MKSAAPARPTYGELMDAARLDVNAATGLLARAAITDTAAARDVIAARGLLLGALGRDAAAVIGPVRLEALRQGAPRGRAGEVRDPRIPQLLAWIDTLETHDQPTKLNRRGSQDVVGHLAAARVNVQAATDLVLTHHRAAGPLRAGAPGDLAAADTGALLTECARLVAVAAGTEPLALRCRQAGMTQADIDEALPVGDTLVEDTWALAAALRFPPSAIRDLTVATPPIRHGDPAAEWGDRMARIDTRMHRHGLRGQASVRTLLDVARLGLATCHVLATTGLRDPVRQGEFTDQWRAIVEHLAPLRGSRPLDTVIRHDVQEMLHLAHPSHAAQTDNTASGLPARGRLLRAIDAGVPRLDRCSAIAGRLLAASDDAWIPPKPTAAYLRPVRHDGLSAKKAPPRAAPWPIMNDPPTPPPGMGMA